MRTYSINFLVSNKLKPGELYRFYKRNNICEAKYGKVISEKVLGHPGIWVSAYNGKILIGFIRAIFDGLSAEIVEYCLGLKFQNFNNYRNGSFIDSDPYGIAKKMITILLSELRKKGCYFYSANLHSKQEQRFFSSLGFIENKGMRNYVIDARPYVPNGSIKYKELLKINNTL
jgi:hypothetical protein